MRTQTGLQDYNEIRSIGEALAGLDRLVRFDWPRYLAQLASMTGPAHSDIANKLAALPAINSSTNFGQLEERLLEITNPLLFTRASPPELGDTDIRVRLQQAIHHRINVILAKVAYHDQRRMIVFLVSERMYRTAEELSKWGVSRPSGTRTRQSTNGPMPPLVVNC